MPVKTVIDSGPLTALFDRSDQYHQLCIDFLRSFDGQLVSTVAVLTEVTHLLDFSVAAQIDFIRWVADGAIELVEVSSADLARIVVLAQQYADLPMDFADGSLVAISERLDIRRIITLDSDFHVYQLKGKRFFENVLLDR